MEKSSLGTRHTSCAPDKVPFANRKTNSQYNRSDQCNEKKYGIWISILELPMPQPAFVDKQ